MVFVIKSELDVKSNKKLCLKSFGCCQCAPRAPFLFPEGAATWGFTGIQGQNSDVKGAGNPKSEREKQRNYF